MKEDATLKRPWTVTIAVYMLYLSLGLSMIDSLWSWSKGQFSALPLVIVPLVLGLWLTVAIVFYMVGRGRNWARIFVLIQCLLGAPFGLLSIIQDASRHSAYARPLYEIIQLEIHIVVVVLLFQRASSHWFKAVKKQGGKDESEAAI